MRGAGGCGLLCAPSVVQESGAAWILISLERNWTGFGIAKQSFTGISKIWNSSIKMGRLSNGFRGSWCRLQERGCCYFAGWSGWMLPRTLTGGSREIASRKAALLDPARKMRESSRCPSCGAEIISGKNIAGIAAISSEK
jgi:hypothetical protein